MVDTDIHYLLIFPQLGIACVSWIQTIFSLNRFRGLCKFTPPELAGFILYIISGSCKWVAAMASKQNSFSFQLSSSLIGTLLYTAGFTIIFNNNFTLATKQQWISILLAILSTSLWEIQSRMIVNL